MIFVFTWIVPPVLRNTKFMWLLPIAASWLLPSEFQRDIVQGQLVVSLFEKKVEPENTKVLLLAVPVGTAAPKVG